MIKFPFYILIFFISASCAGFNANTAHISDIDITKENQTLAVIKKPEIPVQIMGTGLAKDYIMADFLAKNNFNLQIDPLNFARLYIEEASFEGVNHDIAFAQMCLETGFLKFGNLVTPDQNNFAGLGATGQLKADGTLEKGLYFSDLRTGVRAHIQHLKAYASDEDLNMELVNPRRRYVKLGSSPTIDGLSGTWAADRQYAEKIKAMLRRLYELL